MDKYIMAIDQGTTSSRVIIYNSSSEVVAVEQKEFTQYFPHPGWVEHNANEIWTSVMGIISTAVAKARITPDQIAGIGITNQRETTVVWDRTTGLPIYNAIVWQSRQTSEITDKLIADGYSEMVREKTGLPIDPYFSASKIRWILDHVPNAQKLAEEGKLQAGTIDSWLIYCLSGKKEHLTDYTNASRTMLYNIYEKKWDEELCGLLNIPMNMLPEVKDSSGIFTYTNPSLFFGHEIPICGVAGDQEAALFGQGCFNKGDIKNTYGTGCFLLMNTGKEPQKSKNGLVTTIAWGINGELTYALEGSVFVAGSAVQWLRDELHFFPSAYMTENMANLVKDHHDVIVVPAFTGLGAPYWDAKCRGAIFGLTRGSSTEDITKATLDSLAYQTRDVLDAMADDISSPIGSVRVDGGACANNYLMQFQSDILQLPVIRPANIETTALGAAHLAGLAVGFWTMDDLNATDSERVFNPQMESEQSQHLYSRWKQAVNAARMFPSED